MSSGPANVVMNQGPARPVARRVQIDVSPDDKRLLEAASRIPAVLDAFNIPWQYVAAVVKPVGAKAADIGAAALEKLLGTVNYVGPPFNEQVDATQWSLPDRTRAPASPAVVLPALLRDRVQSVTDLAGVVVRRAEQAIQAGRDTLLAADEAIQAAEEQAAQLRAQQSAADAAQIVAAAAAAEARASKLAHEQQVYNAQKEHQMLERREGALKKAQQALDSATVRALCVFR